MRFSQLRTRVCCSVIILAFLVLGLVIVQPAHAEDTSNVSWADPLTLQIEKRKDLSVEEFQYYSKNIPCEPATAHEWGEAPPSSWLEPRLEYDFAGCNVPMASAYFDTNNNALLPYNEKRIQRLRSIDFDYNTAAQIFPAPYTNQLAFVLNAYYPWSDGGPKLKVVNDWTASFNPSLTTDGFSNVERVRSQPYDFELKSIDGTNVEVRTNGLVFSPNGEWLHVLARDKAHLLINTKTHAVLPFAPPDESSFVQFVSVSNDGRYVAMTFNENSIKIYDTTRCGAPTGEFVSRNCASIDLFSPLLIDYFGNDNFRINHLDFIGTGDAIDINIGFPHSGDWTYAQYRLKLPTHQETKYLALGDSFGSGEGAYNYRSPTDYYFDSSSFNTCHQSKNSYPYLINNALKLDWFGSVACSGSDSNDVLSINLDSFRYDGIKRLHANGVDEQNPSITNGLLPGYRPQGWFVNNLKPTISTISIGGNDIGFGNIMQSCVGNNTDCFDTVQERSQLVKQIDAKVPEWISLFQRLHQEQPTGGKLYVLGYPKLIRSDGVCEPNVQMNKFEREFGNALVDYLNDSIRVAANKAQVTYIDVSDAFIDHEKGIDYRLCGNSEIKAVHGLGLISPLTECGSQVATGQPHCSESYHPNAIGQLLLARAIDSATQGLTLQMPISATNETSGSENLRNVLIDGTPNVINSSPYNYNNIIGGAVGTYELIKGKAVEYSQDISNLINRTGNVLRRNAQIFAEIHSDPLQIGTATINDNGEITGTITIPDTIAVGYHQLHLLIPKIDGSIYDSYEIVYVAASESDSDGDGVNNSQDVCPIAPQSDIDKDRDGIDDACDSEYITKEEDSNPQATMVKDAVQQGIISYEEAKRIAIEEDSSLAKTAEVENSNTTSIAIEDTKPVQQTQNDDAKPSSTNDTTWLFIALIVIILAVPLLLLRKLSKKRR